eukprot:GHVN01004388.1.p1 GENE.GHVN01004388.1~~GHVN01004388.1.p1  ORF type:complete len:271 (+),score=27.03 GHVN01004388.1:32-814(+)
MKAYLTVCVLWGNLVAVSARDGNILAGISDQLGDGISDQLGGQLGAGDLLKSLRANIQQGGLGEGLVGEMSAGDLVKNLSLDGLPHVEQLLEGTDLQNLASNPLEGLNLGSLGIDSAFTDGGLRGAFSELRDSFVSIVGEGQGIGLSPQQTAEKFLSANSGKFSVPDLGAFLESTNGGGDFVERVRDAALRDLPGLFRQPKRQLVGLPYFEYLDTGFAYFTSKGFADGLSPQETVQNLIDEALRTDQFDGLVGLLGGGEV